jgi:molybdenum cofactor cytidylyltransferase
MTMHLSRALRVRPKDVVVLVGAGGKTTLMFRLADELAAAGQRVVTTMTTKIFAGQMAHAPGCLVLQGEDASLTQLEDMLAQHGHVLAVGSTDVEADKVQGLSPGLVDRITNHPTVDAVIVEADGSRRRPFKAPAGHEPVIPNSATVVVPVAGLDVLGCPLTDEHVHRPHLVAALTGAALGDPVVPEMVATVLAHLHGGAKGVPASARLVPFLNKAEDESAFGAARETARLLLTHPCVDSVLIGAAQAANPVREVWSRVGAVILAAGEAKRFGALKQVLPWRGKPLVAYVAGQALACPDLDRVVLTVGARAEEVEAALAAIDLTGFRKPVRSVYVPDWAEGQSRSVQRGLHAITSACWPDGLNPKLASGPLGAVLFLLADQPGVTPELLSALVRRHRETLAPVVAPRYQGQRGNPVLFDRATFPEFAYLQGDIGARPIIQAHQGEIAWVDWPTAEILQDIDTVADYRPEA